MHRRSFLPVLPEHDIAAILLSEAADALMVNDLRRCEKLLLKADLRPLREYAYLICGPINPDIHRQSKNPIYPPIPKNVLPRMPRAAVTRDILIRDGFRCRFCEAKVIVKQAQRVFAKVLPDAVRWGRTNEEKHFGLSILTASIDHILPFKRGGTNDPDNLVTACGPCQFGRNQWLLEEVEIEDPRFYEPVNDHWDGLSRLVKFQLTDNDRA